MSNSRPDISKAVCPRCASATRSSFLEQTSHALRQMCTVPTDHVWFGLPHSDSRCVRINGVPVQSGRIAVHRGGRNFELMTPDALQFLGIVVKEDMLMAYARQFECDDWLTEMLGRPVLEVSETKKRTVQQNCLSILHHPRQNQSAPLYQSLSDQALSALFSLFEEAKPVAEDRSSSRQRHRLVERADAYVRSRSDRLVTVFRAVHRAQYQQARAAARLPGGSRRRATCLHPRHQPETACAASSRTPTRPMRRCRMQPQPTASGI